MSSKEALSISQQLPMKCPLVDYIRGGRTINLIIRSLCWGRWATVKVTDCKLTMKYVNSTQVRFFERDLGQVSKTKLFF